MKLRKITACTMAALMITMSLAGCSDDNDKKDSKNSDTKEESLISKGEGTGYGAKEETVYVTTSADGTVENILVSEWLKNTEGYATLKDVTNLTDIVNVKGNEEFTTNNGEISFETSGNDIYYQGSLDASTTLPVSMKITYMIDDTKVDAGDIVGKSGKLTMTIEYIANEKTESGLYVPFLAATGMLLPAENFQNVSVEGGQVLSNGNYNIVIGMGIPGISESLGLELPNTVTITADVTDYNIDMMMTVVTNKIFSADIDSESMDGLSDITDMVKLLSESALKLTDGAATLKDGIMTLKDSSSDLMAGVKKLTAGADTLSIKLKELSSGANTLYSGIKGDLTTGVTNLNNGLNQLYDGAKQVNAGVNTLNTTMEGMIANIQSTIQSNQNTITTLQQLVAAYGSTATIPNDGRLCVDVINQLSGANAALNQILSQLTTADANGQTMSDKLNALATGSAALETGSKNAASGSKTLLESIAQKITPGASQISSGSAQLYEGAATLAAGLGELNSKLPALTEGIDKLLEGSTELSNGMSEFNESAIQKIASIYQNDLQKAFADIKTVAEAGKNYQTLTGTAEGTTGTTTFIIKTNY